MLVSQISVFVENKQGSLSTVTGILANAGIDIRAFSVADTTDFGILRLIVNDPDKAQDVLRENGIAVTKTSVLAVALNDMPGAMHSVLELLSQHNISIEYGYAFISRRKETAYVLVRVNEIERAAEILKNNGMTLASADEVYAL